MTIRLHEAPYSRLSDDELAAWSAIPPAVASDVMDRAGAMKGAMSPVAPGAAIAAQARTVKTMVADNGPIHAAMDLIAEGEALVIDAGGYADQAVFGGLLAQRAMHVGCAGVVVDGAVRDAAELRVFALPVFSTAITPSGPHKGFGGDIDAPVSCAGCVVRPGDLILGDDDGIVVVPLERAGDLLAKAQAKLASEEDIVERMKAGERLSDMSHVPAPVKA